MTTPEYPIRTERLLLRPLRHEDRDDLAAYRSIPDVCRYVPFSPQGLVDIDRHLAGQGSTTSLPEEAGKNLTLGVELDGRVIGDIILIRPAEPAGTAEIGYVFAPEVAGHGYATEACRPLLALAFDVLGMHRVIGRLDERNGPSARVLERLGMRLEAHFVEDDWFKGEWTSTLVYAILDREWRDRQER
jgi:RimJ/RimL family protein N-acetyltransferase